MIALFVKKEFRQQGIGRRLQEEAQQRYPSLQGQVSSQFAARSAYGLGRRPVDQPDATLEQVLALLDQESSVNLVTPTFQRDVLGPPQVDPSPPIDEGANRVIDRGFATNLGLKGKELKEARALEKLEYDTLVKYMNRVYTNSTAKILGFNARRKEREQLTQYADELTQLLGLPALKGFFVSSGGQNNKALGSFYGAPGKNKAFIVANSRSLEKGITPKVVDTLNHEIGHYVEVTALRQADDSTLQAIVGAFTQDIINLNNDPELVEIAKRQRNGQGTRSSEAPYALFGLQGGPASVEKILQTELGVNTLVDRKYAQSFTEWHAQKISAAIARRQNTEGAESRSLLQKYFSDLAERLRSLFDYIRGSRFATASSDTTMDQYLAGILATAQTRPAVDVARGGSLENRQRTTFGNRFPTEGSNPAFAFDQTFQSTGENINFIEEGRIALSSDNTVRTRLAEPPSASLNRMRGGIGLLPSTDSLEPISNNRITLNKVSKRLGVSLQPELISSDSIPSEVKEAIPEGRIAKGYTYKGKAYVVAENIENESDLEATLREEVFHRGLPTLLGKRFTIELDNIYNARGGIDGLVRLAGQLGDPQFETRYRSLIATVQAQPFSNEARSARHELVQEVLARAAEDPSVDTGLIPYLKRIYAQVRKLASGMGIPVDLTSDADLLLMVREAFKAGKDANSAVDPESIQFSLASDNLGLLTNSPDGLQVTDTGGTRDASTLRSRAAEDAQGVRSIVEDWITGKRQGRKGALRQTVANSEWYNQLQQTISQVHAPLIQHDVNVSKSATGFSGDVLAAVGRADEFLDTRPLLQKVLDAVTDPRQILAPASYVVLQKNKARDVFNRLEISPEGKTLQALEQELTLHLRALRDATGESEKLVMKSANRYAIARSAKDRNRVLWYTSGAKLRDADLNRARDEMVEALRSGDATVWQDLVELVDAHVTRPDDYTASGMTDSEADTYLAAAARDPSTAVHYENFYKSLRDMVEGTNNMDRKTGKFSNSVEQVSRAYGWQDTYLPFKGQDEDTDSSIRGLYGSALDDSFRPVEGRESLPDVLATVLHQAGKSAEYNAAQETSAAVMVNVAAYTNSPAFRDIDRKGLFKGKVTEYNINGGEFKRLLTKKDPTRVIYFNPDNDGSSLQTASVINLTNQAGVDAIKGKTSAAADGVEDVLRKARIPQTTSFISSLLTYRNAPFLPFDAIRTTLTYAYNIGTDQDFGAVQDYTRLLMSGGYMSTIGTFSKLLAQKNYAGLDAFVAEQGPNSLAAELDEFIKLGGRNEFTESIRLDPLETVGTAQASAGGARKALKDFDNVFQSINNATDMMGRFAYYKTKVDRGTSKKAAAAQAVNLANFGARGTWSGPLGGIYAFFRATASGAFGQANQLLNGENTGPMMAAGAGAGIMLYALAVALSDHDDEGNNLVAEMDGKRFVKDMSFRLAGQDVRFGTGFGGIANAIAAGVQMSRFSMGHQSMQDTLDNIISAVKDTSAVVPLSGIGITSDPLSFFADSITPSLGKPMLQFLTNTNGLGFDVYQGEPDDPYAGRLATKGTLAENIAIAASQAGIVDVNPDVLQMFAQSYLGTVWSAMTAADELYSEATDENHNFNWRKGTYLGNQFYGPESFTQIQSDYYDQVEWSLGQQGRIRALRRAGFGEQADLMEEDPRYVEALPLAEQSRRDLESITDQYRDTLYNAADYTDGQRKQAYSEASQRRRQTMRQYLDDVALRNNIRL